MVQVLSRPNLSHEKSVSSFLRPFSFMRAKLGDTCLLIHEKHGVLKLMSTVAKSRKRQCITDCKYDNYASNHSMQKEQKIGGNIGFQSKGNINIQKACNWWIYRSERSCGWYRELTNGFTKYRKTICTLEILRQHKTRIKYTFYWQPLSIRHSALGKTFTKGAGSVVSNECDRRLRKRAPSEFAFKSLIPYSSLANTLYLLTLSRTTQSEKKRNKTFNRMTQGVTVSLSRNDQQETKFHSITFFMHSGRPKCCHSQTIEGALTKIWTFRTLPRQYLKLWFLINGKWIFYFNHEMTIAARSTDGIPKKHSCLICQYFWIFCCVIWDTRYMPQGTMSHISNAMS